MEGFMQFGCLYWNCHLAQVAKSLPFNSFLQVLPMVGSFSFFTPQWTYLFYLTFSQWFLLPSFTFYGRFNIVDTSPIEKHWRSQHLNLGCTLTKSELPEMTLRQFWSNLWEAWNFLRFFGLEILTLGALSHHVRSLISLRFLCCKKAQASYLERFVHWEKKGGKWRKREWLRGSYWERRREIERERDLTTSQLSSPWTFNHLNGNSRHRGTEACHPHYVLPNICSRERDKILLL